MPRRPRRPTPRRSSALDTTHGRPSSGLVRDPAFHVAAYVRDRPGTTEADVFIDGPVMRFAIADAGQRYHVPMLCAAASFTTDRGS